MSRAETVRELVKSVQETEHRFLLHGPRHDPVYLPWMPYQPADFIGILWECMPEIDQPAKFLDIGCGPGTKMEIARVLFGLDVHGIEIDSDMFKEALTRFPGAVAPGSALEYDSIYREMDITWLYRPYRQWRDQLALENHVISRMKPGAILAGSSWETDPASLGWLPIVDDCLHSPDGTAKIIRGAWQKPRTA